GGMRVRLDSTELARLHGCTGPLFFSLSIAMCVMTSVYWRQQKNGSSARDKTRHPPQPGGPVPISRSALATGWFTFALAYTQLVLGDYLRHPRIDWGPNQFRAIAIVHVVTALFLLLQVLGITRSAWRLPVQLRSPALLMSLLVLCQVFLGIATWRSKYGWPSFIPIAPGSSLTNFTVKAESIWQAVTVTGHVAVGSLILAATVCYATRLTRAGFLASQTSCRSRPDTSNELTTSLSAVPRAQGAVI
ncbi:MAG: hypothetical protein ACE1Y4_18840, partial [Lysobacterales bacterium]